MSLLGLLALAACIVAAFALAGRQDETIELAPTAPPANPSAGDERVAAELVAGRKIEAIKLYREIHAVGLREAKQAVEALQRRRPRA